MAFFIGLAAISLFLILYSIIEDANEARE